MLYIEELYLKGFRTIQGLKTTLKPGLNIIIGKNGTGKTNFLQFLAKVLRFSKVDIPEFSSTFYFHKLSTDNYWKLTIDNSIQDDLAAKGIIRTNNQKVEVEENGIKRKWPSKAEDLGKNPVDIILNFIKHGLPNEYLVVDKPFKFLFYAGGNAAPLLGDITNPEVPHFLKGLFINLYFSLHEREPDFSSEGNFVAITKEALNTAFRYLEQLQLPLNKYSNITNIRVNQEYNITVDKERGEITVSNLFLEFHLNNQWLPFSSLSDGTKRLFYIISEIAIRTDFRYTAGSFGKSDEEQPVIVLLEEPELGIHPHMLFNLMQFLKESAEDKQIIITTHSPEVVDVLQADELDRILICKLHAGKTELHRLSQEQLKKASAFMQNEAYLSDFWKYSDLEE